MYFLYRIEKCCRNNVSSLLFLRSLQFAQLVRMASDARISATIVRMPPPVVHLMVSVGARQDLSGAHAQKVGDIKKVSRFNSIWIPLGPQHITLTSDF